MNKKKIFSILSSAALFLTMNTTTLTVNAENDKINKLEQEQKELEKKSNELSDGINSAEKEMNALNAERQEMMDEIKSIQKNIQELLGEIAEQQQEINRLEEEIEKINEEIEILQEKIDERDRVLAAQARNIQTDGSPQNLVDLVLSAESLTELVGKMEVVNLIVKNNNAIMEAQIADRELVENHKAKVDAAKQETTRVKDEMEANRASLEGQKVALDDKIEIVSEKYDLTASEKSELVSNQNSLANKTKEIQKEIAAEKQKIEAEKARKAAEAEAKRVAAAEAEAQRIAATKPVETSSSAPAPAPATPNSSGWSRPANGYVTSEFGYRIHPIYGTRRLHGGIDIGGGGPITAARGGTVTIAGYDASWGNYVRIDHGNGFASLYAHMQPGLQVSAGQSVAQGQQLGIMGTTGSSTGVHLHFEIYQNGDRVNPRNFVNF